jgi:hypothetical protein
MWRDVSLSTRWVSKADVPVGNKILLALCYSAISAISFWRLSDGTRGVNHGEDGATSAEISELLMNCNRVDAQNGMRLQAAAIRM